ncbi:serine protease [Mortierella sp. AD094]|nr:serine protease [Mortierella sp. AD094]
MLIKFSIVATVLLVASSSSAVSFQYSFHSEILAPIVSSVKAEVIPDSYFVVFKSGINANDHASWFRDIHDQDIAKNGIWDNRDEYNFTSGVKHVYDIGSFQGLAGRFRPEVLDEIRRNPNVDYIERDQVVHLTETQKNAPWGLARISHRKTLTYKTKSRYEHNPNGGEGVTVFVIDTGIKLSHNEFEGRASWGATFAEGAPNVDDHGHGTHCSGTVGGVNVGVAKKAHLVAVKVIGSDGTGTVSGVIAGIDFAHKQHLALKAERGDKHRGSVVSMSVIYEKSRLIDSVISNAVGDGLHFSVGAGNDNDDSCDYSPAGSKDAITVGASNVRDERAYFSNHGPCVDIFAPGVNVLSAGISSDSATIYGSGTSMATPHVSGLIAYILSLAPEKDSSFNSGPISPKEMKTLLKETATRNVLEDIDSRTPNLLIYNGRKTDGYYTW